MENTTINEIGRKYDFEFERIIGNVLENKPKNVVLQFPDGLKQYSGLVFDYLKKRTKEKGIEVNFFIWMGSCYGACDYPLHLENMKGDEKIDLIIQFGHNEKMPDY